MSDRGSSDNGWRVVLETRDPSGVPYTNVYAHVLAASRDEAIDYALEGFTGMSGGERHLLAGWRVVSAWGVHEDLVGGDVQVEPITEPIFRRVTR
jgi:hypothetical protein